jgi:hypothetical protein
VLPTANTFYLHATDAAVRVVRWERPQVEVTIETRPPIAWRIANEYDENGVYVVAIKRTGFPNVTQVAIQAIIPQDLHLALRVDGGLVTLDHIHGTLHIPPETPLRDTPTLPSGR